MSHLFLRRMRGESTKKRIQNNNKNTFNTQRLFWLMLASLLEHIRTSFSLFFVVFFSLLRLINNFCCLVNLFFCPPSLFLFCVCFFVIFIFCFWKFPALKAIKCLELSQIICNETLKMHSIRKRTPKFFFFFLDFMVSPKTSCRMSNRGQRIIIVTVKICFSFLLTISIVKINQLVNSVVHFFLLVCLSVGFVERQSDPFNVYMNAMKMKMKCR